MVSKWVIDANSNMISYEYIPKGICSSLIKVFIDENSDTLINIAILGGCHGYLVSMLRLMKGMKIHDLIKILKGVKCGNRNTSCPDQIANACESYLKESKKNIEMSNH